MEKIEEESLEEGKIHKHEIDMTSGSVLKKMLLFSFPLMGSSILQLLFNAADIIVIGRFAGDNSLAAVGATASLINLLVNLFVGLAIGADSEVLRGEEGCGHQPDRAYLDSAEYRLRRGACSNRNSDFQPDFGDDGNAG